VQVLNFKVNLITKTSFVKTQNNMKVQKKVNKLKKNKIITNMQFVSNIKVKDTIYKKNVNIRISNESLLCQC
jgi:hypothetical protein